MALKEYMTQYCFRKELLSVASKFLQFKIILIALRMVLTLMVVAELDLKG